MDTQITESAIDSQGYRITLVPSKHPTRYRLILDLGFRKVSPGELDFSGEGYFRSKRKAKHIHVNSNSWGVNAFVVEQYDFRWIVIVCDGKEYITTKEFLTTFGKCETYSNYERQYFLSIQMWGLDAVREFEKQKKQTAAQLSLFEDAA